MRISRWFFTLPVAMGFACTDPVKDDTAGDPTSRLLAPSGVIRGSLLYQGPRPCSSNGHIVGNAILLVFDRRSPPPPAGLSTTAVNFAAIPGDVLFANEPRWGGADVYCPAQRGFTETLTASAPFAISPLVGASYIIESFFDTTGDFIPLIKFRELPERGDVAGGDIDTADALKAVNQNPNYQPIFEPVDVGIPRRGDAGAGLIPIYDIPPEGYVADNVQVTIGKVLSTTRPYFYAEGMLATPPATASGALTVTEAQTSAQYWNSPGNTSTTLIAASQEFAKGVSGADPEHYAPVLTIPQDIRTFAPPTQGLMAGQPGADKFEGGGVDSKGNKIAGLPHLRLRWSGSDPLVSSAKGAPFNMQIAPFTGTASGGDLNVWQGEWLDTSGPAPIWRPQYIPDSVYKRADGSGVPVPLMWPLVILSKLIDDPHHTLDPASLQPQGSAAAPVVIMQGITLWGGDDSPTPSTATDNDSLFNTVSEPVLLDPNHFIDQATGTPKIFHQDHITALLRPATICFNTLFDASNSDKRGNIVTPYLFGESTDSPPLADTPIVPLDLLTNGDPARAQVTNLVKAPAGWTAASKLPPAIPGCLPKGRYAINVVYPDGQAWTVPNEAGACTGTASTGEGTTNWSMTPVCSLQNRNVVTSQGPRAVVEIVGPTDPNNCKPNAAVPPTPSICLAAPQ